MQPHVTCALVFTHYLWVTHHYKDYKPKNLENFRVSYMNRRGEYVDVYYVGKDFTPSTDKLSYEMTFMKSNGGDNCKMKVRRKSVRDDAEVEMEHGTQHISGLKHEFTLAKRDITGGRHHNSENFLRFNLRVISDADPKKFQITSTALKGGGGTVDLDIRADILD